MHSVHSVCLNALRLAKLPIKYAHVQPFVHTSSTHNECRGKLPLHIACRAGLTLPAVEVRFENLGVEAGVFVGSRNLPTVLNSSRNFFEVLLDFPL